MPPSAAPSSPRLTGALSCKWRRGDDPALWQVPASAFTSGTPLANSAGMGVLAKRDREATSSGQAAPHRHECRSSGDELGHARAAPHQQGTGGEGCWSMFCTTWEGLDLSVPGSHQAIRGNGERAGSAGQPFGAGRRCARLGSKPRTRPPRSRSVTSSGYCPPWHGTCMVELSGGAVPGLPDLCRDAGCWRIAQD